MNLPIRGTGIRPPDSFGLLFRQPWPFMKATGRKKELTEIFQFNSSEGKV